MLVTQSRPAFSGIYPVSDAALYVHSAMQDLRPKQALHRKAIEEITTKHLFYWVREGMAAEYLVGLRGREVVLSFLDLVSLRMIAAMRAHGVKPKEIRFAHQALQSKWNSTHPFAMERIWVFGGDVFVKEGITLLAASKGWYPAFDFIKEYLIPVPGLTFGVDGKAIAWEPAKEILLDPFIQFGDPCIKGTRVSTEVIWSFRCAGDSIHELSRMYGLKTHQIEAAIGWEKRLAAKN